MLMSYLERTWCDCTPAAPQRCADISSTTYHKHTTLHNVVTENHADMVQLLLKAGIEVSNKDYF